MNYKGYEQALANVGINLTKTDFINIEKKAKNGKYQEALEELAAKNGDALTPQEIVLEARDKKSVLHKAFEWDDSVAGEKYRLMQARVMVNNIRIKIDGKKEPAFFNARVVIENKVVQKYFPAQRVKTNEEIRNAILQDLIKEIRHLQQKYRTVIELSGIIDEEKVKSLESQLTE